jgi:hypothetical protein
MGSAGNAFDREFAAAPPYAAKLQIASAAMCVVPIRLTLVLEAIA